MNGVRALLPETLRAWNDEGKSYTLLDVRTPQECAIVALDPAVRIPMNEIPARFDEIPTSVPVVVMCHHGDRSAHVAAFLAARGLSDVYNLDGGIDAYARQIDPAMSRY